MVISKKDTEKRLRVVKNEIAALEAKCASGQGKQEDYIALAKLKKKVK